MQNPNLLFLFTDEQRADTLSAYGNRKINMPHLDGLARRSFVFRNAYVTQPVCSPSRSTILTGLYPHTTGCTENNIPLPTDPQPLKTRLFQRAYFEKGHSGLPLASERDWRRMIANYWGLCSLVDTQAGTILNTLRDCGLEERTLDPLPDTR